MSGETSTFGFGEQSFQADNFVGFFVASLESGCHAISADSAFGNDTFADTFVASVLVSSHTL